VNLNDPNLPLLEAVVRALGALPSDSSSWAVVLRRNRALISEEIPTVLKAHARRPIDIEKTFSAD
jgi:hypothetical protein